MLEELSNKVNSYYHKSNALGKQLVSIENSLVYPDFPDTETEKGEAEFGPVMSCMKNTIEQSEHLSHLYSLHSGILNRLCKHFNALKSEMTKIHDHHRLECRSEQTDTGITSGTKEHDWESHISYMTHMINTRIDNMRRKKLLVDSLLTYSRRIVEIHNASETVSSLSKEVIATKMHELLTSLKELNSTFEIILNVYETKKYFRMNCTQVLELTNIITERKQQLKNLMVSLKTKFPYTPNHTHNTELNLVSCLTNLDKIQTYTDRMLKTPILNDPKYTSSFRNVVSMCNRIQRMIETSRIRIHKHHDQARDTKQSERIRLIQRAIHNSIQGLKAPDLS